VSGSQIELNGLQRWLNGEGDPACVTEADSHGG